MAPRTVIPPVTEAALSSVSFAGLQFDDLSLTAIIDRVIDASAHDGFSYLVTPNVDHVVRLHGSWKNELAQAYQQATWSVCDSRVLALLARLRGARIQVSPGSDLVPLLLARLDAEGDQRLIAVVGSDHASFQALTDRFRNLNLVQIGAPRGLAHDAKARSAVCAMMHRVRPALSLLAVGSPQQELIAAEYGRSKDACGVALCVGASLDFIIGRQIRAPRWMQRAKLEWLHRLGSNPRQMWRRYLVDGPKILSIVLTSPPPRSTFHRQINR